MREATGNLWDFPADWRVIPTNGYVRKDGAAVMGRGLARQAKQRFPGLEYTLGELLNDGGNHVYCLPEISIITFPVKYNWRDKASMSLIECSVWELLNELVDSQVSVALPRVGCGNGKLRWTEVKTLLIPLDDRFTCVHF